MSNPLLPVDVVGLGINSTDTMIRLPRFPTSDSKLEFRSSEVLLGGQVASAMVAYSRWGLQCRYVGSIGDDSYGELQKSAMAQEQVEAHWVVTPNCQSQSTYILVDEGYGERTILWKRDPRLAIPPGRVDKDWVLQAKLLHVDGHDCPAATRAAHWAREAGLPVVADLDNRYPGVEALLEDVDFAITSREFPDRLTGERNLFVSLPQIAARFGCRVTAATLGDEGALLWDGLKFRYQPAFAVSAIDTTGAGDIFHAAFAFGVLNGWDIDRQLEFSSAAAGLACTGLGARGGIATISQIEELIRTGRRRPSSFAKPQLEASRTMP